MRRPMKWVCPYCGTKNSYVFSDEPSSSRALPDFTYGRPSIAICETDAGGCEEYVALRFRVTVECEALPIGYPAPEKAADGGEG